jgi:hypothetical protein
MKERNRKAKRKGSQSHMPLCKVAKWSFMTLDTLTIGADKEFKTNQTLYRNFKVLTY